MSYELKIYENTSVEEIDIMIEALQKTKELKLKKEVAAPSKSTTTSLTRPAFRDPRIPPAIVKDTK